MPRPKESRWWIMIGVIVAALGCRVNRIDAPYPQAARNPHGRAIDRLVGKGPLSECPVRSLASGARRELAAPVVREEFEPARSQRRVALQVDPEYEFVHPIARFETRWLGGHRGRAWEWRPGLGLLALNSWQVTRQEDGHTADFLFQVASSAAYIPFAPGDRWRVGDVQECGTWADERPIRVLLFSLTGPDEARYHGVSAYWRGRQENDWVSFLGLGSSATAQAEFLTMLRTSR